MLGGIRNARTTGLIDWCMVYCQWYCWDSKQRLPSESGGKEEVRRDLECMFDGIWLLATSINDGENIIIVMVGIYLVRNEEREVPVVTYLTTYIYTYVPYVPYVRTNRTGTTQHTVFVNSGREGAHLTKSVRWLRLEVPTLSPFGHIVRKMGTIYVYRVIITYYDYLYVMYIYIFRCTHPPNSIGKNVGIAR